MTIIQTIKLAIHAGRIGGLFVENGIFVFLFSSARNGGLSRNPRDDEPNFPLEEDSF